MRGHRRGNFEAGSAGSTVETVWARRHRVRVVFSGQEGTGVDAFSVLLVDDEEEFLETLVKRLAKRKLMVTGVTNAQDAIRILNEKPIDVVVLDVKMPGMDGLEALREIKNTSPQVEVIMLTGHANMEAAIQGMELGAFDYLMKPMDIDELLYKLQDAYKKKTLQEQAR
jgi:DNA-binding NtrC family response regulator